MNRLALPAAHGWCGTSGKSAVLCPGQTSEIARVRSPSTAVCTAPPAHATACALPDLEAAVALARHPSLTRWEQHLLLVATHHASPFEASLLRTEVAGGVENVIGFALAWIRVGFGRGVLRRQAREAGAGAWDLGLVGEEA